MTVWIDDPGLSLHTVNREEVSLCQQIETADGVHKSPVKNPSPKTSKTPENRGSSAMSAVSFVNNNKTVRLGVEKTAKTTSQGGREH